jgi:hypothetical protein
MRVKIITVASLAVASLAGTAGAAGRGAKEHAAIAAYEGTKTCAACHAKQVEDVVTSLHYQQQGPAPFLASAQQAKNAGMMVSY